MNGRYPAVKDGWLGNSSSDDFPSYTPKNTKFLIQGETHFLYGPGYTGYVAGFSMSWIVIIHETLDGMAPYIHQSTMTYPLYPHMFHDQYILKLLIHLKPYNVGKTMPQTIPQSWPFL